MGWDNPPIPWRELERRLSWRDPRHEAPPPEDRPGEPHPDPQPSPPPPPPSPEDNDPEWAELHCHSSYSFLDGASSPADLVAEAAERGLAALALTDHDGMYGVPQFAQAAARQKAATGTRLSTVFGAELSLDLPSGQGGIPDPAGRHLLVLARDPEGYRRLCQVISEAQLAGQEKGRPVYSLDRLAATDANTPVPRMPSRTRWKWMAYLPRIPSLPRWRNSA